MNTGNMESKLENIKNKVKNDFREYFDDNWCDYEGEWDDFKEEARETLWNGDFTQPIIEDYETLLIMLENIQIQIEEYGIEFKEYHDPQRVFNLGMYLIATKVLEEIPEPQEVNIETERMI